MEPRFIVPVHWYTDRSGVDHEVLVRQLQEGNPPRLISRRMSGLNFPGVDVDLASLFELRLRPDLEISQAVGDGPHRATLPCPHARDAVEAAVRAIPASLGAFRVVWVPNDPRVPF